MKVGVEQLTVRNGDQVLKALGLAFSKGDNVLDFEGVTHVDSTALAVILQAKRLLKSNTALELRNPPAQLQGLMSAYGVQSLFE